jgi:hypothetical protein
MDMVVAMAGEDIEVMGVMEAIKVKEIITITLYATGVTKEVILTAIALPNSFNLQMELLNKIAKVKLMLFLVTKASNNCLH